MNSKHRFISEIFFIKEFTLMMFNDVYRYTYCNYGNIHRHFLTRAAEHRLFQIQQSNLLKDKGV